MTSPTTATTEERAARILLDAGIPQAVFDQNDKDETVATTAGFVLVADGKRIVSVATVARDAQSEGAKGGERSALFQEARAALDNAGWELRTSDHGTLRAVAPKES